MNPHDLICIIAGAGFGAAGALAGVILWVVSTRRRIRRNIVLPERRIPVTRI
jgi:hypothetical protein